MQNLHSQTKEKVKNIWSFLCSLQPQWFSKLHCVSRLCDFMLFITISFHVNNNYTSEMQIRINKLKYANI